MLSLFCTDTRAQFALDSTQCTLAEHLRCSRAQRGPLTLFLRVVLSVLQVRNDDGQDHQEHHKPVASSTLLNDEVDDWCHCRIRGDELLRSLARFASLVGRTTYLVDLGEAEASVPYKSDHTSYKIVCAANDLGLMAAPRARCRASDERNVCRFLDVEAGCWTDPSARSTSGRRRIHSDSSYDGQHSGGSTACHDRESSHAHSAHFVGAPSYSGCAVSGPSSLGGSFGSICCRAHWTAAVAHVDAVSRSTACTTSSS